MSFSDDPRRLLPPKREPHFKKRPRPKMALCKPPKIPGRWYKCKTLEWEVPNRSTGTPLGLDVGGFKFDDSDAARWELLPKDMEVITLAQLLPKFRREWRWWKTPITFARNPEKEGSLIFGLQDIIIAIYPKGFYITVERYHREIYGPHAARLFYRSYQVPEEIAWVAICQINQYWYSDERMLAALNHEIRNKKLWHSTQTAHTIVLQ